MRSKKIMALFMTLALLLSIVPLNAIALSTTNINVGTVSGRQGDTVSVSVSVSSGSQMQAFSFSLEYDKDVVEVISATKGNALNATPIINTNVAGKIVFSYAATTPVTSSGAVLDVSFKIKENAPFGQSDLTLIVNEFADGSFATIDYNVKNGQVVVIAPKLEAPAEIQLKEIGDSYAEIMWTGNDDATGYNIYLNGSLYNDSPLTDNVYQFLDLEQNTQYQIQITNLHYTVESDKTEVFAFQTTKTLYDVMFVDWNYNVFDVLEGSVLHTTRVEHGAAAVPPQTPVREGYKFVSWDTDFSNVISDLVIQAQYEPVVCVVLFVDWDGTIISEQTVQYGGSAEAPASPSRNGFVFTTWNKTFNNVTEDIIVQAQYEEITCEHNNIEVQGKVESTCKIAGFAGNIVCTDCGETISIGGELELAEHDYKSVVTNPTPSSQGFTTHTCIVCGDNYIDSYVDYVDENAPQIVVDSKKSMSGKTIDVTISLKNNPGIVSATMRVTYDSNILTLIRVTDAGVLGSTSHKPELINPYTLVWVNDTATSNFTSNGKIVTLTFEVSENVPLGKYPITVAYDYDNYDIYNANAEKVKFVTVNGYIEIIDVMIGDVNSDGLVNNLDRMVLTRYLADWEDYGEDSINSIAADVNSDGLVNNLDRMVLTRHLADWEGYESLPYAN